VTDPFDLRRSARLCPNHDALVSDTRTWSYLEVWHAADATAQWLVAHGVSSDTQWVAIEPRRDIASVLMVWTLMSLGIPFIVIHPAWSEAQKAGVVKRTGAVHVPITAGASASNLDAASSNDSSYALLRRTPAEADPLCVVYTSGTTSEPKGVILSRRAFVTSSHEAAQWLRLNATDRWLLSLPLAHVGGLSVLTRAWLTHSCVIVPPGNANSFDASGFVAACRDARATLVSLVPTQLQRICSRALDAPSTLRCVLLGGAPTPPALLAKATQLGFKVVRTYGLTELCSMVATEPLPTTPALVSAGREALRLHSHVQARVGPGGRLLLRSEALFSGYWGGESQQPNEWFTTEDLAELDNQTQLRILGRADDAIITGGEKVHPTQVEAVLSVCPNIEQACVFARSSRMGSRGLRGTRNRARFLFARYRKLLARVPALVQHTSRLGPRFSLAHQSEWQGPSSKRRK
jgi:o-succinylbenzoate---CoA ligase